MLKIVASIGVGAALCLPPVMAAAQTGYGVKPGSPSTSTFDRSWNRANESKDRARASADYVRERRRAAHPYHHAPRRQAQ